MRFSCFDCCAVLLLCGAVLGETAQAQQSARLPVRAAGDQNGANVRLVNGQQPLWVAGEHSTGKRPIEVARSGKGSQFVLVVGSVAGNDPESIELIDATCQLARMYPPPDPVTLLFVRTPNPDGLAEHVHTNQRGVELDRNFPSRNFTSAPNRLTGPKPASEVETQYMVRVLQEFKPVRVIHLKSGVGDRPLVMISDKWQATTGAAMLPKDISQDRYQGTFKAGSLEEYVSVEMETAIGTVVLSKGSRQMQAAEILRLAVGNISKNPNPADNLAKANPPAKTPAAQPAAPAAAQRPMTPEAAPKGNQGEVELLPPPPEFAPTSTPSQQVDRNDSRYFELPPPPR
ncbi:M14 family zinc carboxypeptidase [Planctomicrobium piriforme]|uniref:Zinc carboxypeptidase n=1 Tax=Planctomicrobium piriforme TaxID=1576369 RepID=A0A1I3RQK2_9PLAN|nr:M14 family zinc carboxypeptidase [Planctomicrobium piriforme]SFJ48320.1 Zinc carboxypeptidase [Planctomicrobium piriforme]